MRVDCAGPECLTRIRFFRTVRQCIPRLCVPWLGFDRSRVYSMDGNEQQRNYDRNTGRIIVLLFVAIVLASCGGENSFLLTVLNSSASTETIRIDLAGDTRELGVGGYTEFRSVAKGAHILSVDSATCSGVVRDTLEVTADTIFRYQIVRDVNTGECEFVAIYDVFRSVTPTGP